MRGWGARKEGAAGGGGSLAPSVKARRGEWFRDGVGLVGVTMKPHPKVAAAGVAGALMLFRDRVPVRDSCVLRSCGGAAERGCHPRGPAPPAPACAWAPSLPQAARKPQSADTARRPLPLHGLGS